MVEELGFGLGQSQDLGTLQSLRLLSIEEESVV